MTTITFRTNDELKKNAKCLLNSLGITLSEALNMFLNQLVLKQKFPCSLDINKYEIKPHYPEEFYNLFGSDKDLDFIEPNDPPQLP